MSGGLLGLMKSSLSSLQGAWTVGIPNSCFASRKGQADLCTTCGKWGHVCRVLNAKDISVTGRKMTDKIYYWHTGYIGHLKERRLKDQMEKDPTEVIRKAVTRMLPRNRLRDDRDRKLRIFCGSEHLFHDRPLERFIMPPCQVREIRPRPRRAMIRAQKKLEQADRGVSKAECDAKKAKAELENFKDTIKDNQEKIKFNKQLPFLVGSIVECRPGGGIYVEGCRCIDSKRGNGESSGATAGRRLRLEHWSSSRTLPAPGSTLGCRHLLSVSFDGYLL